MLARLYVLLLLLLPDGSPVSSTATPDQWQALRALSTELELTTPGVERWDTSFAAEINWHRLQLRHAAYLPPLAFTAGLPDYDDCRGRLDFARRRLTWLEWQTCPACEGAHAAAMCDQRRRIRVWSLTATAANPQACALYRREAIAELWEMTGGVLPCPVALAQFREIP